MKWDDDWSNCHTTATKLATVTELKVALEKMVEVMPDEAPGVVLVTSRVYRELVKQQPASAIPGRYVPFAGIAVEVFDDPHELMKRANALKMQGKKVCIST